MLTPMRRAALSSVVAILVWATGCDGEDPAPPRPPDSPTEPVTERPGPYRPAPPDLARDGTWPASREGLVFAFASATEPVLAFDARGRPLPSDRTVPVRLEPRGRAIVDRYGRLQLADGSCVATGAGAFIRAGPRRTGALSLEATLEPADLAERGTREIVSFGPAEGPRNFALSQYGPQLIVTLRTSAAPEPTDVTLMTLTKARPVTVAVAYEEGRLVAFKNGRRVHKTETITGDLSTWTEGPLVLGSAPDGSRDWAGRLQGVAVFMRALSAEEAKVNADAMATRTGKQTPLEPLRVRATLIDRSTTPAAAVIEPHRQGLSVFLWEVEEVLEGELPPGIRHVLVAHWTILSGDVLPFTAAPRGAELELRLDPIERHPQLQSALRFDDLDERHGGAVFDLPVYYDAGGTSLEWTP